MLQTWMWLQEGLGYSAPNTAGVLQAYPGGAQEVLQDIGSLSLNGVVTPTQAKRLANSRPEDFSPVLHKMQEKGIVGIAYNQTNYPERLRSIYNPPLVLYVKGDAGLLNGYLYIGMVGARNPSAYGIQAVQTIGQGLAASGAVIVSGLAAGLDAESHKAALAVGAPTVACIAFGHNHCYPAANRGLMDIIARYGAVVSEYPPHQKPEKAFFLQRNRMIAGLSHGVLVAEARQRSGTMSTVNYATEWGRDVFAVPGSIFSGLSGGTHAMIREGAILAAGAQDVLDQYAGAEEEKPPPKRRSPGRAAPSKQEKQLAKAGQSLAAALETVSEDAKQVFACLSARPAGLQAICDGSGLAAGVAMAALTELELAGLSRQLPGRQFTIHS